MTAAAVLADLVAVKGCVVIDGAMGTQLFAVGLDSGDSPELWNVDRPTEIQAVHRSYFQAGADVVLTNSFGGNRFRLELHGLERRVRELNRAAARNARIAADEEAEHSGRPVLVAGSMGPTGSLMVPMGDLTSAACESVFAEQAEGLATGGADLLWIETMSDLDEAEAAVIGAREGADLPVVVTMSFDTSGHTMMGVSGDEAGRRLGGLGLVAMGANCGSILADTEAAVVQFVAAAHADTLVVSKPNAGIPVWRGDALTYDGTPDVMAACAHRMRIAGAVIIGACCGSTPTHIAEIASVLHDVSSLGRS